MHARSQRLTVLFALASLLACPHAGAEMMANMAMDKDLAQFVTQTVDIAGAVKNPVQLHVADLQKYPQHRIASVPVININGQKMGRMENLKGVLLRDLLQKAEVIAPGHNDVKKTVIVATASDGYKVLYTWSEIFNSPIGDGALVYFEKNKSPLGNDEGRIAMISAKDLRTGPRHVKWLKAIEVRKVVE